MKKMMYALLITAAVTGMGCKKDKNKINSANCDLPSTAVPAAVVGNWANGYNSSTHIVDAYNGQYLGNNWQSGKYFHFSADGKYAEFYYMAGSFSSQTATRVTGTVSFDEAEGSFVFHGCSGHYRGWQNGTLTLDRDATAAEVNEFLTQKYFYSFENSGGTTWMQIRFDPAGTPSSFRSVP